ncbi:MAG: septum formation initiator family protein [Elusimicrobia bacterium]|nr:septum formation initiator family protein [Elusimicrobiota bacterium]
MSRPDPSVWLREHWVKVLGTVGLLAVFFGNQGFRSLVRNWLELRSLSREIASLEGENTRTALRLKELRENPSALEREARKVGFTKAGEIEYRFEPPKK